MQNPGEVFEPLWVEVFFSLLQVALIVLLFAIGSRSESVSSGARDDVQAGCGGEH